MAKTEKQPEPPVLVPGAVIDRIEVTASRKIGLPQFGSLGKTVTLGANVAQGANVEEVFFGLHSLANEWAEGLALAQADLILESEFPKDDAPATVVQVEPGVTAQAAPTAPVPAEDGQFYRDLKVTAACYLQRVVTNNGTHKCNALVKPLTVHGVDAWEEPLDAFAGTADWRDWTIGQKVLLAPLGVKTVRVLCKPDGRTPIKVWAFLKE